MKSLEMAVDIGSAWGLKKLFGEETEEEKRATEKYAAAVNAKESATSKVPHEGGPRLYTCLCYPKEELMKEDEERYEPRYEEVLTRLPKMFLKWPLLKDLSRLLVYLVVSGPSILLKHSQIIECVLAIKQRYNKEPLPKMFNDWAKTYGKRYHSVYEWRLRFKIWLSAKKVTERRCSITGQTFSIYQMNSTADQTVIERERLHGYKPGKIPLSEVERNVLLMMGKRWMKKMGKEFDKWAERHERVYSSTEEREKRRLAYMENRRLIDLEEELYPGLWEYGNDLENMDKFDWEADLCPIAACPSCRPRKMS